VAIVETDIYRRICSIHQSRRSDMNPLSDIRQKIIDGSVQLVDVREEELWSSYREGRILPIGVQAPDHHVDQS